MTRRVLRTIAAERDLIAIGAYVAMDNPGAARRLLARLDSKGAVLLAHPSIGRPDSQRPGRRILIVGSYLIVYRDHPDGILILRYLHGRRNIRRIP